MVEEAVLMGFFKRVAVDPVIDAKHIALFMALYNVWMANGCRDPVVVRSHTIMPLAKISSGATYFSKLNYLHQGGYLRYVPSHCGLRGSRVYFSSIHGTCNDHLYFPNAN